MIGADAGMNVSAASISTGGALFANIFNFGGNIVGSATSASISLAISPLRATRTF